MVQNDTRKRYVSHACFFLRFGRGTKDIADFAKTQLKARLHSIMLYCIYTFIPNFFHFIDRTRVNFFFEYLATDAARDGPGLNGFWGGCLALIAVLQKRLFSTSRTLTFRFDFRYCRNGL